MEDFKFPRWKKERSFFSPGGVKFSKDTREESESPSSSSKISSKHWRTEHSYFSPVAVKASDSSWQRGVGDDSSLLQRGGGGDSSLGCPSGPAIMKALYQAIESRDPESVAEVLAYNGGGDIDVNGILSGHTMSALHTSVGFSGNDPDIVEALLRRGGDPNNQNTEEKLSPLHISVMLDYDMVARVLVEYGGDPKLKGGDGRNCYEIAITNVQEELMENCFGYFFSTSKEFRKSIAVHPRRYADVQDSECDGFYSCTSQLGSGANSHHEALHSVARKLFPMEYPNLMTEDESEDSDTSTDSDQRKKLTTIPEESGIGSSNSPFPLSPSVRLSRGINSMTAPHYYFTDDSISVTSDASQAASMSCYNSTPPVTPQPTQEQIAKLHEQLKDLKLPITPSTFNVISKYTESETGLKNLRTPKIGKDNFSSELQSAIMDFNLINEWGNLKIDLLQNATPTANMSKSYYNYLLLDPKVIRKGNFSGNLLKTGVINSSEKFEKFLLSVFYIGKGCGKRPLQHLVEAKAKWLAMGRKPIPSGEKIDKILEIWKSGLGVLIVSVFHHSSEREANVNEACMIDAVGLAELSNQKKGSYTGTLAQSWPQKMKNQLGSFLLYKSFCNFAVSDHNNWKSFSPQDI